MREIRRWIADDGTVFDTEEECARYEQRSDYLLMSQYLRIFDRKGKLARWGDYWHNIGYVQVLKPFCEMTKDEVGAWERIGDCELDELINYWEEGWYFQDDNDRWHNWATYSKDFYAIRDEMNKLIGDNE
jgi:hypothetical protein